MKQVTGAVCGGAGKRYHVRVRFPGYKNYKVVGRPTKSYSVAVMRLAKAMVTQQYKRGEVLMSADYYEPLTVMEMVRR